MCTSSVRFARQSVRPASSQLRTSMHTLIEHVRPGGRTASRPIDRAFVRDRGGPRARVSAVRTKSTAGVRSLHLRRSATMALWWWVATGESGPAAFSLRGPDTPWRPRRGPWPRPPTRSPAVRCCRSTPAAGPTHTSHTVHTPLANSACNAPRRLFTWGRWERTQGRLRPTAPGARFVAPATPTRPVRTRVADGDRPIAGRAAGQAQIVARHRW